MHLAYNTKHGLSQFYVQIDNTITSALAIYSYKRTQQHSNTYTYLHTSTSCSEKWSELQIKVMIWLLVSD